MHLEDFTKKHSRHTMAYSHSRSRRHGPIGWKVEPIQFPRRIPTGHRRSHACTMSVTFIDFTANLTGLTPGTLIRSGGVRKKKR